MISAGVNSTAAVALTSTLEQRLGMDLPPTLVFDYPTIRDIVSYLSTAIPSPSLSQHAPHDAAARSARRQLPHHVDMHEASGTAGASNAADNQSIEAVIAAAVHGVLHGDMDSSASPDLDPDQPLMNMGINSSLAVALTSSLEDSFSIQLPPTLIFDCPTVSAIAEFIQTEYDPAMPIGPTDQAAVVDTLDIRSTAHNADEFSRIARGRGALVSSMSPVDRMPRPLMPHAEEHGARGGSTQEIVITGVAQQAPGLSGWTAALPSMYTTFSTFNEGKTGSFTYVSV